MSTSLRKGFLESEEAQEIRQVFQSMTLSDAYNTAPSYSTDTILYPNNLIPFTDKHMNYLNTHPKLEAKQYIVNIKLMSRV